MNFSAAAELHSTPGTEPPVPAGEGQLILVAESDPIVRDVVEAVLKRQRYEVIAADNGIAALELFASRRGEIRLVFSEISLPGVDGVTLMRIVRKLNPWTAALMTSASEAAIRSLAQSGYNSGRVLAKPFTPRSLIEHVTVLLEEPQHISLTHRERQIFRLVARGRSNLESAAELGISPKTAENHRRSLMLKIGARNVADLTREAFRLGVIH